LFFNSEKTDLGKIYVKRRQYYSFFNFAARLHFYFCNASFVKPLPQTIALFNNPAKSFRCIFSEFSMFKIRA